MRRALTVLSALLLLEALPLTAQLPDTSNLLSDRLIRQRLSFALMRAREAQASAIALEAHIQTTYNAVHGRIVRDSLRAIMVPPRPDSTPPPTPGANSMFFNSAECDPADTNLLLCDDFEDGDWYRVNCGTALSTGGLLQSDGWCGTIYHDVGLDSTAVCNGAGFRSNCAATTAGITGTDGNMADIALREGVREVWIRFYTKPLAGYGFGAEKMLTINDKTAGWGGIHFGGLGINCGSGATGATGRVDVGLPVPMDVCQGPNVSSISLQAGNWYFVELHFRLATPGGADGLVELWIDNCGPAGLSCPATPTLRTRVVNVRNPPDYSMIRVLWFESWSNPQSRGQRYTDQILVSKVGPIGFMK